jgi:hypothetical protein
LTHRRPGALDLWTSSRAFADANGIAMRRAPSHGAKSSRSNGSYFSGTAPNGRTLSWTAPIEHNATNVSDAEVRVLEIEFKD